MGSKGIGFDPRAFEGLLGWYKPADKSQVTLETGVSLLSELGPAGSDLAQAVATDQPAYDKANGRWMMKGDGISENIGVSTTSAYWKYMSVFLIYKSDAAQVTYASLFASDTGGSSDNTFQIDYNGDTLRVNASDIANVDIEPSAGNRDLSLAELHFNMDDPIFAGYHNGVLTESVVDDWQAAGPRFDYLKFLENRGGESHFNGWLGEALVYASNTSPAPYRNRAYIAERLMKEWSI